MIKLINAAEYLFLTAGVVLAISDVKDILCIVLLIVDSCWLLLKVILLIFKYCSDGELTKEEIEEIEREIEKNERKNN